MAGSSRIPRWERVAVVVGAYVGLEGAAGTLTPFAPRRLGADAERPVAARTGKEKDDDGLPLIAGIPAVALLLGAGLVAVRRRR